MLEHKIEAAEIAILAKSYIKRFDSENGTFVELYQVPLGSWVRKITNNIEKVEGARKRSLASQMQRLLTQIVTLPEYKWVFWFSISC